MNDICIRKVGRLQGRARTIANEMNLDSNDLVIVETIIIPGALPKYKLERVVGSPIKYLLNKIEKAPQIIDGRCAVCGTPITSDPIGYSPPCAWCPKCKEMRD